MWRSSGVDGKQSHALELISAIVKQATCPVIADIESDDDSFLKNAARRGIFAYVKHGEQPGMEHAMVDVAQAFTLSYPLFKPRSTDTE